MKLLAEGAIATTPGTLAYTATTNDGYNTTVQDIEITNTTAAALTIALHLVKAGGTVGTSNAMFQDISIPAKTLMQWNGNTVLNLGGFIQVIGSGAGLSMRISGEEVRA